MDVTWLSHQSTETRCRPVKNTTKYINVNPSLKTFSDSHTGHIVLGDINYRDIDWQGDIASHDKNSKEHNFLEATNESYLDKNAEKPKRVVRHNKPSLLLLLLTD